MIRAELRGGNVRKYLGTLGVWIAILAVAALAGILGFRNARVAVGLSAAVLVTSIVFLDGRRWNFFSNYGWIPYAWIALFLTPEFRFTSRDPLDTSISSTSLESFIQVIAYLLVAALVTHHRRILLLVDPTPIRKGPLLIWPMIALASTLWSIVPLFTFVRASQLLVPIGLALLMARIWRSSPARAAEIWRDTLRLYVQVVTLLVLIGFAAGFLQEPRFSWPGVHPGTASLNMGLALLILGASGRALLGFRTSGYVVRVVLFVVGLYLGETRTVIAALLVSLAVMFWWIGRTKPLTKYLGLLYYGVAFALIVVVAAPEIMQYLSRGGGSEGLTSLNGRIPLWSLSIDLLNDAGKWLTGFGYGAARVILPTHVEWAGTAHSSWLELLLAIGVIGPLLAITDILHLFVHAGSRRSVTPPALILSLLAFLVVASIASETLAFPGVGFAMLALLHAPVMAERSSWGPKAAPYTASASSFRVRPTVTRRA